MTLERELLPDGHPARRSSDAGRENRHSYVFPNKSEIICGGLDNPDRIMSTEFDMILVVEATEITEEGWEKLLTRLRNNRLPFQQAIAECNPSNPSHWLNKRGDSGRMVRLLSRHSDNPSLRAEYLKNLSQLTGHRRSRLFEGLWVAAEGGVFPEFSTKNNVVAPFDVPAEWPVWLLIDPGYDHPCGVSWNTIAPNGWRFTIDEIKVRQTNIKDLASMIHRRRRGVTRIYIDPAGSQERQESPISFQNQLTAEGLSSELWPRASKEDHDASVAAHRQDIVSGKYHVFSTCVETISEHQSWKYKRNLRGEILSGDDQYEDANNDILDGILGWERTKPIWKDCSSPRRIEVVANA